MGETPNVQSPSDISPFNIQFTTQAGAKQLMEWPAVRVPLENNTEELPLLHMVYQPSEKWLFEITEDFNQTSPLNEPFDIFSNSYQAYSSCGAIGITDELADKLCTAYFRYFHCAYPILDRDSFTTNVLPNYRRSFDQQSEDSALLLMVFALGAVAEEATTTTPIVERRKGKASGIKSATISQLPGIAFANEAKRRLGLMFTQYSVTILQGHLLLAYVLQSWKHCMLI